MWILYKWTIKVCDFNKIINYIEQTCLFLTLLREIERKRSRVSNLDHLDFLTSHNYEFQFFTLSRADLYSNNPISFGTLLYHPLLYDSPPTIYNFPAHSSSTIRRKRLPSSSSLKVNSCANTTTDRVHLNNNRNCSDEWTGTGGNE